jgi:predicted dehydrogenase
MVELLNISPSMTGKIKICVVGTGLMGLQHIKAIVKSNKASLHSIVDIGNNAIGLSKKFKVTLFKDTKELLAQNKPDAVIIATPNQLHEEHTLRFLKKKIPVLLEKPISDNIKSAKKIINSSKKNKTPLLIGYHRRHNLIVSKVKNIISSGKLGKIISVNILCWLYKHKNYYNEKWRMQKGGGPLGINLVHDIDMICFLLGPVKYVQAFTTNRNRKFKVEDTAIVSLINQSAYMIGGDKGSLQFPNLKIWYYKKERSWWNNILVSKDKNIKDDNTLVNQINHFTDVITKKIKPKVNGNDGIISLKIFDAIKKSSKSGKKVRI